MTAATQEVLPSAQLPPQSQERAVERVSPNAVLPAHEERLGHHMVDTQNPNARANGSDQSAIVSHATAVRTEKGSSGRKSSVAVSTQMTSDNLPLSTLHDLLGHYARQLWDLQKTRIVTGNRIEAMRRNGDTPDHYTVMLDTLEQLKVNEHAVDLHLTRLVRRHFMADWIKQAPGIGLPGFARLMGVTGPLDRFATVSKLWAYLGMHVVDGVAPKRQKGVKGNWSPQGRVLCHQIADSIVKLNRGKYRAVYDVRKARTGESHPEWTQAHRHNDASRVAVKELLKDLWVEWQRRSGRTNGDIRIACATDVA